MGPRGHIRRQKLVSPVSDWSSKMSRDKVILLLVLLASQVIEARRDVQKYDYVSFGLGGLRPATTSVGRRQVGLRTIGSHDIKEEEISKRSSNYLISPISDQIIHLATQADQREKLADSLSERYNSLLSSNEPSQQWLECRTIRTGVELSKDDYDKSSGQLVRNCKGTVALNRCEGACSSSVLPSIKSRNGFKKECRCCNESSFRRIQVRLRECYSPIDNRRIVGTAPGGGGSGEDELPNSYMDIEVEEPTDCRCRACEAYL